MGMLAVFLLICVVMYFAFPETATKIVSESQIGLGKLLAKIGISNGTTNANAP